VGEAVEVVVDSTRLHIRAGLLAVTHPVAVVKVAEAMAQME